MRTLLTATLCLLLAAPLAAQEPGDSVRVYQTVQDVRLEGRLVGYDADTLRVWSAARERAVARSDVSEVRVWESRNTALFLTGGAVGGALGSAVGPEEPWTGTRAGDAAVGAAGGLLVTLAIDAIWPGSWRDAEL